MLWGQSGQFETNVFSQHPLSRSCCVEMFKCLRFFGQNASTSFGGLVLLSEGNSGRGSHVDEAERTARQRLPAAGAARDLKCDRQRSA